MDIIDRADIFNIPSHAQIKGYMRTPIGYKKGLALIVSLERRINPFGV